MRIIVAHKDDKIAEEIASRFTAHGCTVDIVEDPEDPDFFEFALQRTNTTAFAIIAPNCIDSFNEAAPQKNGKRPLIFDIGKAQELDENTLAGIFSNVARNHGYEDGHVLKVAGLEINMMDYNKHILNGNHGNIAIKKDGKMIRLTKTEYRILRFLALNRNRTLSQNDILCSIYKEDEEKTTENVKLRVFSLRKKIETDPSKPKIIQAFRKRGYVLVDEATSHLQDFEQHGPLKFRTDSSVTYNDVPLMLEPQQREILYFIAINSKRVLARQEIFDHIHGETSRKKPRIESINLSISKIRKAIAKASQTEDAPFGINVIKIVGDDSYQWQNPEKIKPRNAFPFIRITERQCRK